MTSSAMGRPLSSLYLYLMVAYDVKPTQSLDKWRVDLPSLDDEILEECVATFIPQMVAAKDRLIQLKFLHWAYYTPQRLARIFPLETQCVPGVEWRRVYSGTWSGPALNFNLTGRRLLILLRYTDPA